MTARLRRAMILCAGAGLCLWLVGCTPPPAVRPPGTLPVYAHNDYRNDRPLFGALELGFSGVEADVFLVDGELLVAHDRREVRPGRTLRRLYLDPLRDIVRKRGSVIPMGGVFLLNIELKEDDPAAFGNLHALLLEYRDVLSGVTYGGEETGAVQVVLVGHHPPLAELAALPERRFAVQSYARDLAGSPAEVPAHLLHLVTARYGDHFAWRGDGAPPPEFAATAADLVALRDEVPGRRLRVFKVPRRGAVHQALIAAGVDLIGSEDPPAAARLYPVTDR